MLWFLSLALALTCSLLATFVQQWTRDFIHKTTIYPSPVRRARVIAFMYFGLRDFGMHTFVDVIPILLHVSLIFFFAGLVGFLLPVNGPLTFLMCSVLLSFLALYVGLTFLPLLYLNSPYQTPMSSAIWRFLNAINIDAIGGFLERRHRLGRRDYTLMQAMLEKSLHDTSDRDQQAMVFAMKSLNDDNELLPFIEAIPDALYDPSSSTSYPIPGDPPRTRTINRSVLMPLLESSDPEINLISRITQLISKSNRWTEANAFRSRSALACPKALWSIAFTLIHGDQNLPNIRSLRTGDHHNSEPKIYWFNRNTIRALYHAQNSLHGKYVKSAAAAMHLSRMHSMQQCLDLIKIILVEAAPFTIQRTNADGSWQNHLRSCFSRAYKIWSRIGLDPLRGFQAFSDRCKTLTGILRSGSTSLNPYQELIDADAVIRVLKEESTWMPIRLSILSGYLHAALHSVASTGELPHEFMLMGDTIYPKTLQGAAVDLHLDANEEAALVDTITSPLRLLQHSLEVGQIAFDEKTDALLVQSVKLFFSIGRSKALSNNVPHAVKARYIIQWYICRRAQTQIRIDELLELELLDNINMNFDLMELKNVNMYKNFHPDDLVRIGDCILKDLESTRSAWSDSSTVSSNTLSPAHVHVHLMAAYLVFSQNEDLFALHPYENEFSYRLFETLKKAPKVMKLDQMFPLVKGVVDRMMCKAVDVFPECFWMDLSRV